MNAEQCSSFRRDQSNLSNLYLFIYSPDSWPPSDMSNRFNVGFPSPPSPISHNKWWSRRKQVFSCLYIVIHSLDFFGRLFAQLGLSASETRTKTAETAWDGVIVLFLPVTKGRLTVITGLGGDNKHALYSVSPVIQRSRVCTICSASVCAVIHLFTYIVASFGLSCKDRTRVNNLFSVLLCPLSWSRGKKKQNILGDHLRKHYAP